MSIGCGRGKSAMTMWINSRSFHLCLPIIRILKPTPPEPGLNTEKEILSLLDEILSLNGRSAGFSLDTPLIGAIPELDSMAVVALLTQLEERFGFGVDDDEIDGAVFATVGSLVEFVDRKLAA